jgi:hypothetical protein
VFSIKHFILFTKEKISLIEMIFFLIFIKKVFVTVVGVCDHSVDVFEHLREGLHSSSFYVMPVAKVSTVSENLLSRFRGSIWSSVNFWKHIYAIIYNNNDFRVWWCEIKIIIFLDLQKIMWDLIFDPKFFQLCEVNNFDYVRYIQLHLPGNIEEKLVIIKDIDRDHNLYKKVVELWKE